MLDMNSTKIKRIEELYVVLQCVGIILAMAISKHILDSKIIFQGNMKYFIFTYLIYSFFRVVIIFGNSNFKKDSKYKPNFYLFVVDGIFLVVLLYLSKKQIDAMMPILYLYIMFQIILFTEIKSFIIVTFISLSYIFIKKQTNLNFLFSLEVLMNISFMYILSIILHLLIKDIRKLGKQIQYMLKDLKNKNNKLSDAASRDYLTNMYNHRSFYSGFYNVLNLPSDNSHFCMAMFDIDNFKKINDTYGHLAGDLVIKEIASIILNNTRKSDIASRYGGEEFAILFPDTSLEEGIKICERVRKDIESHCFNSGICKIKVTISCGISSMRVDNIKTNKQVEFIDYVDKLLYEAKRCGKNQVRWKKAS